MLLASETWQSRASGGVVIVGLLRKRRSDQGTLATKSQLQLRLSLSKTYTISRIGAFNRFLLRLCRLDQCHVELKMIAQGRYARRDGSAA